MHVEAPLEQNETGLWHVCLPPHIDTHRIENTKVVHLKDHRSAFNCLCLQSGKTIWANMFSMCRIHITSNCCRHWPGSRETWRSPQLLQYSLRHFDLSQKKELLRLLSVLFHCFCVEATNCSCRVWYVLTLPRSSWWCSDSRGFLLGIECVATLLEGLHCNE